jgi:hypothetical protein
MKACIAALLESARLMRIATVRGLGYCLERPLDASDGA